MTAGTVQWLEALGASLAAVAVGVIITPGLTRVTLPGRIASSVGWRYKLLDMGV